MRHGTQGVLAWVVLPSIVVLCAVCGEVTGQNVQRGYSSRGVNGINMQRAGVTPRMSRPTNTQSVLRNRPNMAPMNPGGPLSFDVSPLVNGSGAMADAYMFGAADAAAQAGMGLPEGAMSAGVRPSIRPRLDISDRNAVNVQNILGKIRTSVLQQIARCAEKPFSPEWYAAHASVTPIKTIADNPWTGSTWAGISDWVSMTAAPQRYDYQPDDRGLIFVYRDNQRQERAVDARGAAVSLANSAPPTAEEAPGLSLGVFAAIPPVDEPVKSLVHLVLNKSGTLCGYQYDFAADTMEPLHGVMDPASQRVAWKVGTVVTEAGLANLAEDVARALVFRDDGWTQSWILLRVPESAAQELPPAK
jgi:hypothetical protein